MPYTTTHVLVGIILIELFRDFFIKDNKKFPRYYILIMAIASIFPDLEYIFQMPNLHRNLLHTLFVPLLFLILGFITMQTKIKNKEIKKRHLKYIFQIGKNGSYSHNQNIVSRKFFIIFNKKISK